MLGDRSIDRIFRACGLVPCHAICDHGSIQSAETSFYNQIETNKTTLEKLAKRCTRADCKIFFVRLMDRSFPAWLPFPFRLTNRSRLPSGVLDCIIRTLLKCRIASSLVCVARVALASTFARSKAVSSPCSKEISIST